MIWVQDLESIIFTVMKKNFPEKLKEKYPKIEFKTSKDVITDAKFPTIRVHLVTLEEVGNDMENDTVNMVRATVQIDVVSNDSQKTVDSIIWACLEVLKGKRFSFPTMPISSKEGQVYRATMRARRLIGSGENL